jgi:hypothetical protein
VLPSTASVIADMLSRSEKCAGRSDRSAMITSASSGPMFSMWYTAPDSTWYICPGVTTNELNWL